MTTAIKIVAIGDNQVRKSSFLHSLVNNNFTFESDYIPTSFNNQHTEINLNGETVPISLWDTTGEEEYPRLRVLSYEETNIFFLCFDLSSKESLQNIERIWFPEITKYCPEASAILVGLKTKEHPTVSLEDIRVVANQCNLPYSEFSFKSREGLENVFADIHKMIQSSSEKPALKSRKSSCKCSVM